MLNYQYILDKVNVIGLLIIEWKKNLKNNAGQYSLRD